MFYGAWFSYAVSFVEGKWDEAANLLLRSAAGGLPAWRQADAMVRAGILYELCGDMKNAKEVFEKAGRRYPKTICLCYGDLAESFALAFSKDATETSSGICMKLLQELPYPALHRAELFFLAGQLFKKREQFHFAQQCFSMAAAEDTTLNWFTWMAKKELESGGLNVLAGGTNAAS
jgi:tetratricopeptide (TPR) repeat protein